MNEATPMARGWVISSIGYAARVAYYAAAVISLVTFQVAAGAQPSFRFLDDPIGNNAYGVASAVSADGRYVTGWATSPTAFDTDTTLWDLTGGSATHLPHAPELGYWGGATDISSDGAAIVGYSHSPLFTDWSAFVWTAATGRQLLPAATPNETQSEATAVSRDGRVIVGWTNSDAGPFQPVAWTQDRGTLLLNELSGFHQDGVANDVTDDGRIIVGRSGQEPVLWNELGEMEFLGRIEGEDFAMANAVSPDGEFITGYSYRSVNGDPAFSTQLLRWSRETSTVGLGRLGDEQNNEGLAISADGNIIVGASSTTGGSAKAFIWDPEHGIRNLTDVLANDFRLADQLDGALLEYANDITPDGRTIVGMGTDSLGQWRPWVATVPEPDTFALAGVAAMLAALSLRRHTRRARSPTMQ